MPHPEIDVTTTVVEKSALQTKLTLAIGAIGILMTIVNFFLTREISSTASKIDETNRTLTELSATVRVEQARNSFLSERVSSLEAAREKAGAAHEGFEQRLSGLEQLISRHDEQLNGSKR